MAYELQLLGQHVELRSIGLNDGVLLSDQAQQRSELEVAEGLHLVRYAHHSIVHGVVEVTSPMGAGGWCHPLVSPAVAASARKPRRGPARDGNVLPTGSRSQALRHRHRRRDTRA